MQNGSMWKRKRKVHLSTWCILVFTASGWIGLVLLPPRANHYHNHDGNTIVVVRGQGWPIPARKVEYANIDEETALSHYYHDPSGNSFSDPSVVSVSSLRLFYPFSESTIAENSAIGVILLLIIAIVSERR